MALRFAGGLAIGIVVVGGGLVVLSQLAPLQEPSGPVAVASAQPTGQSNTPTPLTPPAAPMVDAGKPSATPEATSAEAATTDPATAGAATTDAATQNAATAGGEVEGAATPNSATTGSATAGAEAEGSASAGAVPEADAPQAVAPQAATTPDAATEGSAPADAAPQAEASGAAAQAGLDAQAAGAQAPGYDAAAASALQEALAAPARQPAESVLKLAAPAEQPAAPVLEPSAPLLQPTEPALQSSDPVPQPSEPILKPAEPALQPTPPVLQPTSPVPQPAEPVAPAAMAAAADLPVLPDVPAAQQAAPALSSLDAALAAQAVEVGPKAAQAVAPDPVGNRDALLVPSQKAGLTEPSRLPQIAAAEDPGLTPAPLPLVLTPAQNDSQPKVAPLAPRVIVPVTPVLPPAKAIQSTMPTTLEPTVPGVATNALPHVGDPPKGRGDTAQAEAAPGPLVTYARLFDGAGGKPLFAILLHDVGGAGMARADLANLPFPVTFVIDPLAADAKEAEATYRAAGQEVLMLADGIPPGATAGDVAQTFQTLAEVLPQAVGVIDMATLGFQDNRALAAMVLPVIADQGRGLVTYDQGLNAADQIARRDGLPAAVVFRRLDGAGESQPTIRRYLDRAAFKAAQEGSVVVLGDTRTDTVAAILQWAIEGKGATVALAPVSAVMGLK